MNFYRTALAIVIATIMAVGLYQVATSSPKIPQWQGAVNDYTNTLTPLEIRDLNDQLRSLRSGKQPIQMVIAVVPDMQGEEVAPYANMMFKEWGIGKRGVDRGLLLLVAKKERKVRFEVGYGLEGELPDALTKRILNQVTPYLAKNRYSTAFTVAIGEVGRSIKKD